jgi:hypothetical protein
MSLKQWFIKKVLRRSEQCEHTWAYYNSRKIKQCVNYPCRVIEPIDNAMPAHTR